MENGWIKVEPIYTGTLTKEPVPCVAMTVNYPRERDGYVEEGKIYFEGMMCKVEEHFFINKTQIIAYE